jgi:hypothetical protein
MTMQPSTRDPPIPAEIEQALWEIYPEAATRHAIRDGIYQHADRLRDQGRDSEIPDYFQRELEAMQEEREAINKGKRRKLFVVVGKTVLAALAILLHLH